MLKISTAPDTACPEPQEQLTQLSLEKQARP